MVDLCHVWLKFGRVWEGGWVFSRLCHIVSRTETSLMYIRLTRLSNITKTCPCNKLQVFTAVRR